MDKDDNAPAEVWSTNWSFSSKFPLFSEGDMRASETKAQYKHKKLKWKSMEGEKVGRGQKSRPEKSTTNNSGIAHT